MLPVRAVEIFSLTLCLLLLSACGADYKARPYHGFPYENIRTAGTGIEYVRAKLAAPRGLETEKKKPYTARRSERLFKETQQKTWHFKLELKPERSAFNQ